jgi:HK97 family phage major capsid protein
VCSSDLYSSVTLNAYKTGALFATSYELITDTSFDIVPYFAENLSNAISTSVGSKLISGSGTAEPQGILTGATVGVTGTATAPSIANILSLWASLPVGYRPGASWVMNPATYATLVGLNDTTGRSLVLSDLSSSQPTTLMGQPVYLDTNMPTAGTANASVFVGDLSRYMIVRYAGGVRLDQSVDYKFNTDELTWRVQMRLDSKVVNSDAARVFIGA